MKRVFFISMIFCGLMLAGCKKDVTPAPDSELPNGSVEPVQPSERPAPIKNGYLFFNDMKVENVDIPENEVFPIGNETSSVMIKSKSGVKSAYDDPAGDFKVNDYRFKLVAQRNALAIALDGVDVPVQATHVKIDDKYAFVSYNKIHEPNIGGLVVYEYTVTHGTLDEATVDLQYVSSIRLPYQQINAIDFDGSKLYLAGATEDLDFFGECEREDRAFLMVLELDAERKFKQEEPVVKQLTSFQATSIRKYKNRIYITTGDGTEGTQGGLYIYNASDYSFDASILGMKQARSVDVDDDYIYLYQANHARVTRYNHDGSGKTPLYEDNGEAWQRDAKSEIMAWKNCLFVAENETGLRMLFKDGNLHQALKAPNFDSPDWNDEVDVTNSMSMNSDVKKDANGEDVTSDLLLVANGRQGIYWYDVTKPLNDPNGQEWIKSNRVNNILRGFGSANYVTSSGNVAFVADGVGGLKVLYIGFNTGTEEPPVTTGSCYEFMDYLVWDGNAIPPLFPETANVFRDDAHPIVKQLFQQPTLADAANTALNYIEVKKETELFLTYMYEGAGWKNALGYIVIPADVPKNDQAEYDYWNQNIKPNMCTVSNGVNVLNDEFAGGGIIFNYVKDKLYGGHMVGGNTYQIGKHDKKFKAGERIVFFVCPDGWTPQNNRVEVTFTAGSTSQIFFMHKFFNKATNIRYSSLYSKGTDSFAGVQMNSLYYADCKGLTVLIEDWHTTGTDVDFNDIIFSISDNIFDEEVTSFVAPEWAVGKKIDGELEILPSKDIMK